MIPYQAGTRLARLCKGLASFLAVFVILCISPAAGQEAAGSPPGYRLGAGDKLRLIVFGHDDLSGEFAIDGAGFVSLPLVGGVAVGGRSVGEAERAIVGALKPDYLKNPRVNLQVLNYRPFYIIGEVNAPGSYPYVNGLTVLEAVAIAGGFTYRARESKMKIIRATDAVQKERNATPQTVVLPGDVIDVPERYF